MLKRIRYILDKKDTSKIIGIFFLILGSAVLDLLSITVILPVISLLSSGSDAVTKSSILGLLSKIFGTNDVDKLFIISLAVITLIFFVKTLYGFLYTKVFSKFSLVYSRKLTKKLMDTYLSMPYEYHLENNSSTLIRKSVYDVGYFVTTISDILSLLVKIVTFVAIIVYLIFINWTVTLITGLMLVAFSIVIIFILKPKTRKISKEVQSLNSNNYKLLAQAFNGIKESKISGTESNFSKQYDKNREKINNQTLKRVMLSSVPNHLIEFVGILGICLSLYLVKQVFHLESSNIIESFTVFVYAIIKLLPMVISSTSIINSFAFYKTSVDTIYDDIKFSESLKVEKVNEEDVEPLKFEKSIKVNNVNFAYSNSLDKQVLKDVSIEIKKNTSVAFVGPSGGGKTTLIDLILGLLSPRKGAIEIDGVNIDSNKKAWRKNVSYIPQTIYLSDDTIRNNVAFGINPKDIDDKKVFEALKKAELDEFVNGLEKKLDTVIGERGVRLSGGQAQRIGIARAFYRDTNVVVFDEATNALDLETEKHIFSHINKLKKDHTLIIVTHREESTKTCDAIYKIDNLKVTKVR